MALVCDVVEEMKNLETLDEKKNGSDLSEKNNEKSQSVYEKLLKLKENCL